MIAALIVAGVLLLAWLYLFLSRARFPAHSLLEFIETEKVPDGWPAVSIVIPARNEGEILRFSLPSVLASYYPRLEVLLVDDCSEDSTAQTARQIGEQHDTVAFRVVAGTTTPPGWRGKPWALEQGLRASRGEWILFTDADVTYDPRLVRDLVRMAVRHGYQMASLMVLLRSETFWDRLLIPAFFFFFHLLYPFHWVRSARSRTAAAAGGCVLVERAALEGAGGLEAIRDAWIDDLALARALKRSGANIYLGATVQAASFRRYGTLKSLRQMVTRSAFTQLRYSWGLLALTLAGLAALFGLPLAGVVAVSLGIFAARPEGLQLLLGVSIGSTLGFMILAYVPALRLYRLPVVWALTLPAAALVYAAMTIESALAHTLGDGVRWKGRAGIKPGRS